MKTNEALAAYESEYARLYESLYKAHRNEKELSEQCASLKVNIKATMHPSRNKELCRQTETEERNDFEEFSCQPAQESEKCRKNVQKTS